VQRRGDLQRDERGPEILLERVEFGVGDLHTPMHLVNVPPFVSLRTSGDKAEKLGEMLFELFHVLRRGVPDPLRSLAREIHFRIDRSSCHKIIHQRVDRSLAAEKVIQGLKPFRRLGAARLQTLHPLINHGQVFLGLSGGLFA
jgi:hypothetical protein